MKPHKTQGWLNPGCTPQELEEGSKVICEVYLNAVENWETNQIKTISLDEKTAIQALERPVADKPMQKGMVRKQEYEYIRHGTQCLTANWDVAMGQIIAPTIGDTRNEADFANHIEQTVQSDATVKQWRFVVDNLNTHQSESLVLLVAKKMNTPTEDLGIKGKCGILKSMESRAAFLQNRQHPIHFVYTPKHCSWLNQIEIWFGIITRKLIKRGNFTSKEHLKEQILKFIDYFNAVLAKPFKWTFNGKPCKS